MRTSNMGLWREWMMAGWSRLIAGGIIGCGFVNAATLKVPARQKGQEIKLETCKVGALNEDARCGKYEVYEDRDSKAGRKISLNIIILPALTSKPAADPVFFLEGGPGV